MGSISVIATLCSHALTVEEKQHGKLIADEVSSHGIKPERIRNLTSEEKRVYQGFLWDEIAEAYRSGLPNAARSPAVTVPLTIMGDDWAREQIVDEFLESPRQRPLVFKHISDPKVISMVGELLFKTEEYEIEGGDLGRPASQSVAAEIVLYTASNSPAFSADVINWARRVDPGREALMLQGEGPELDAIREWYRANESKLKAWDFKAVTPGRLLKSQTPSAAPASSVAPEPTRMAPDTGSPTPGVMATSPAAKRPKWPFVIAALLVAGWALLFRKRGVRNRCQS